MDVGNRRELGTTLIIVMIAYEQEETIMAKVISVAGLILIALLVGPGLSMAEHPGFHGHPWEQQLTEEQRAEVHALVDEMRANGAGPKEVHEAVHELLQGWGIDVPEGGCHRPGHHGPQPFMEELTEEQRTQVHTLASGMRESGARPKEIHEAVRELLQEWGIEVPEGEHHDHVHHAP